MFSPSDDHDKRYDGYGRSRLPSLLDDRITQFIESVVTGAPHVGRSAIETASESGRGVLRAYAGRSAMLAVRQSRRELLERALIAIVIGGMSFEDHEAMIQMSLIDDAGQRLGADLGNLTTKVERVLGTAATEGLRVWNQRDLSSREISTMGYAAGNGSDGFRYVWVDVPFPPKRDRTE